MPIKYEFYMPTADGQYFTHGANWNAMTFTVGSAGNNADHTITSVKLQLNKGGTPPGIFTVSIRDTDGSNLPTGDDLCFGTTDPTTLPAFNNSELREITLGSGTLLSKDTRYAIVIRLPSGADPNMVGWRRLSSGGGADYDGGALINSTDSGVNWSAASADQLFEVWGDATETPTVTTQAVTSIVSTTATGNGNVTDLGGSNVTEHGHCWNTGGLPTTSDSKTTNGSKATTGTFTSSLTSLTSGTLYYVRAYATNTDGTAYGDEVSFTAGSPRGGELSGLYAVVEERLHYVDAYGVERYILGEIV